MLATTLVDAQVDLNPHQVDAALFAFHGPLSKGVILADEVGLGKTIEAGLVIAQRWAERKRRILSQVQPYISCTQRIPLVQRSSHPHPTSRPCIWPWLTICVVPSATLCQQASGN